MEVKHRASSRHALLGQRARPSAAPAGGGERREASVPRGTALARLFTSESRDRTDIERLQREVDELRAEGKNNKWDDPGWDNDGDDTSAGETEDLMGLTTHDVRLIWPEDDRKLTILGTSTNVENAVIHGAHMRDWVNRATRTRSPPSSMSATASGAGVVSLPVAAAPGSGQGKYSVIRIGFAAGFALMGNQNVTVSWFAEDGQTQQSVTVTVSVQDFYAAFCIIPYYMTGASFAPDIALVSPTDTTGIPTALAPTNAFGVGVPAAPVTLPMANSLMVLVQSTIAAPVAPNITVDVTLLSGAQNYVREPMRNAYVKQARRQRMVGARA